MPFDPHKEGDELLSLESCSNKTTSPNLTPTPPLPVFLEKKNVLDALRTWLNTFERREDPLWNWICCRTEAREQRAPFLLGKATHCGPEDHVMPLSHPEAISSPMHEFVLLFSKEEPGIYWERTYGNTFRESVSMKSVMSQGASDVVACLGLAKGGEGWGEGQIRSFRPLFQFHETHTNVHVK